MPGDPRDRNFQNALARNLRAKAPADSPVSRPVPASQADCPDAEILAAYHDRLLTPEDMISRKQHVAGCPRCQEILVQLEVTDEIQLKSGHEQYAPKDVVLMSNAPSAYTVQASASASAGPALAAPQQPAAKLFSASQMLRRSANWRWLAPAGALAAALIIWVAVRQSNPPQFQLAKKQPVADPAPQPAAPLSSEIRAGREPAPKDLPALSAAEKASRQETDAYTRNERAVPDENALASSHADKLIAPSGNLRARDAIAPSQRPRSQLGAAASPQAKNREEKSLAKSSVAPAPPASPIPAMAGTVSSSVPVAPSAPGDEIQARKENSASEPTLTPEPSQTPTNRAVTFALREDMNAQLRNSVSVSSPDGSVTWHLAPAGIIRRSTSTAANTTLQKTGVLADLLAGSAPTSRVCWVVGRSGTILRTTDGGKHWRGVSSPTTEDLTSIFAIDDRQTTITTSTKKPYQTTDAGQTWTPLPVP